MGKRNNSRPLFFKPPKPAKATRHAQGGNAVDCELSIEKLSAEGRGLGYRDGQPVFVAAALPGETVRARILQQHREYAEAELLEVISASERRIEPACEWFGRCGGCQLQMLDYAEQLAHKQRTLEHLLAPFAPRRWDAALVAAPLHYRHRARLAVSAAANGQAQIGFKAAHSHRVQPITHCAVLEPALQRLLPELPGWLDRLSHWQRIDEIVLAADADGRVAMNWRASKPLPAADRELLRELAAIAGVSIEPVQELIYRVPSQQFEFRFGPLDFTQVNPAINDQLVTRALDWLQPQAGERIADFFAGLGNFTLPLARNGSVVTGFEVDAAMVRRAAANAAAAGSSAVSFNCIDLFAETLSLPADYSKALLDPPRAGARQLCERLAAQQLDALLYVSCNPHTLVRDLKILAGGGYRVERAALVDMFPQTGHIEAMALLRRE